MNFQIEPASVKLDETFPRRYAAVLAGALVTHEQFLFVPSKPRLLLDVHRQSGERFRSVIGGGEDGFLDALQTTPDDMALCVVAGGEGYFVDVTDPLVWARVDCDPIHYVIPLKESHLLLFADDTHLVAYGYDGTSADIRLDVRWRSARLGWDRLTILKVDPDTIVGQAWNAPHDEMMQFRVDTKDGSHSGGAY